MFRKRDDKKEAYEDGYAGYEKDYSDHDGKNDYNKHGYVKGYFIFVPEHECQPKKKYYAEGYFKGIVKPVHEEGCRCKKRDYRKDHYDQYQDSEDFYDKF